MNRFWRENNMFPRISIIVPVYNTESYLSKCLDSIINQTYKNIEVILIDDGSTDSSGKICDHYAEVDTRFQVLHTENKGLVSARKTGLACATGDYIGFVDSDDWIKKTMYEELLRLLQDSQADIVCCGAIIVSLSKQKKFYNRMKEGLYNLESLPKLYETMMFDETENAPGILQSIWSKLFKKALLESCLIPVVNEITYGEDAAIVYPYCLKAKRIVVTNETYYYYRENPSSMCGGKNIEIFKKIDLFYKYMNQVFHGYPVEWKLERQLRLYMIHFVKMGLDKNFHLQCNNRYQLPYKQLLDSKKIVLYGAGSVGRSYYEQLIEQDIWEIVLWVDKQGVGQIQNGHVISSVNSLYRAEYDKILIAVKDELMASDIRNKLLLLGIKNEKIVWIQPITKPMEWKLQIVMDSNYKG